MSLFDQLLCEFGYNEPIFIPDIKYKQYSRPWINKELQQLCREGAIKRFEKAVYYIPTQTPLGDSLLDPRKVIDRKYVRSKGEPVGYYAGVTLLNMTGLSTQMPNVIEICSNNEKAKVREVTVGKQKVRVRRPRAQVCADNIAVLRFLELMTIVPASFLKEENKIRIVTKYIADNRITRGAIMKYSSVFPDKATKTLVESGVIFSVTQ